MSRGYLVRTFVWEGGLGGKGGLGWGRVIFWGIYVLKPLYACTITVVHKITERERERAC